MAAVTDVQRLQARVEELERWVYGPGGSRGSRKVADGLVKVQVALGNIASKRERVKILYKKIEDLIKYLDPEYIDRIAIPDASKLQFILAEEQFILSQVALLEQVEALVPMLDSTHIKAVPEHAARLQRLAQIHIQQQDQCVEITEESKALLEEYNKTVSFLLSQAPEKCCPEPCPFIPFLALSLIPSQPACLSPCSPTLQADANLSTPSLRCPFSP
ncbi:dynactin subunit 3 isoform X1 [Kogia breviceps]|uniref:dynactin subunit 3 isoform X1 n=1 Tax=Kogia breviceps TaxID=27615 RepID=UPI002795EB96|nr:dynactin subunit 3 isoform X1 [Kogia breviceps]